MKTLRRGAGRRALLASVLAGLAAVCSAQVFPAYLNYQGKLGDPSGNPLTGTYSFRFRLYDNASAGNLLFTDNSYTGANAASVVNGVYSVQIGSLTAGGIPASAFFNSEVWLEIDVSPGTNFSGAETLIPRERLTTSPFAFRALNASYLGTGVAIATFTTGGVLQVPYGVTSATVTATSSVTASAFFGDGSHLSGITIAPAADTAYNDRDNAWNVPQTFLTASTVTLLGNAFSVGGSTFVISGGNVGVGTTGFASGGKLTVKNAGSQANFLSGETADFSAASAGTQLLLGFGATSGNTYGVVNTLSGGGVAWNNLVLQSGGGNVGIGNTSPQAPLEVNVGDNPPSNAASNMTTGVIINDQAVGPIGLNLGAYNNGGSPYSWIQSGYSNNANVHLPLALNQNGGGVGIGTTAPSVLLDVKDASAGAADLGLQSTTGQKFLVTAGIPGVNNNIFGISRNNRASPDFAINAGNVGVGTYNPATKLHMSSGTLTIDGTNPAVSVAGGSVTASAFFGDGSHLSGIPSTGSIAGVYVQKAGDAMTGPLTMLSGSTLTVAGNAFSVGGSTLVVTGGQVLIGTNNPAVTSGKSVLTLWTSSAGALGTAGTTTMRMFNSGVGNSVFLDMSDANTSDGYLSYTGGFPASSQLIGLGLNTFNQLVVNGNGNVGIGTTSPATKLHMSSGTLTVDGTNPAVSVAGGSVTASAFFGDGSHLTGVPSTGSIAGVYVQKAGDTMTGQLTLSGSTLTVTGNAFSVSSPTFVITGGNIGVGTPNPNFGSGGGTYVTISGGNSRGNLELATTAADADATLAGNLLFSAFNNNGRASGQPIASIQGYVSGAAANDRGGHLDFYTKPDGTGGQREVARLTNGGNLGIATTNPSEKLEVNGAIRATSNAIGFGGNDGVLIDWLASTHQARIAATRNGGVGQSSITFMSYNGSSYVDAMDIVPSGLVGIGTNKPGDSSVTGLSYNYSPILHLNGPGSSDLSISGAASAEIAFIHSSAAADTKEIFLRQANQKLEFSSVNDNGAYKKQAVLLVDGNLGNVGIGTANPVTKLHMSSGTLTIDGTSPAINVAGGSVTASAFFGDGSHLSGVISTTSANGLYVSKGGDTMSGTLSIGVGATQLGGLLISGSNSPGMGLIHDVGNIDYMWRMVADTAVFTTYTGLNGTPSWVSDVFSITPSGRVGIGTTGPRLLLDVRNGSSSNPSNDGNPIANGNATISGASESLTIGSYASGTIWMQGQNINTSNTHRAIAVNPDGGNVGIGTSNPGVLLHILGNGATGNQLRLDAAGGQYTEADWDNGDVQKGTIFWDNTNNVFTMQTAVATSSIAFTINGATKLLIDHSGNVGIGTANPGYALDVSGRGSFFATNQDAGWGMLSLNYGNGTNSNIYAVQVNAWGGTIAAYGAASYGDANNGDLVLYTKNTGTLGERVRVLNNGNVGIGTANPATKLHMSSGTLTIDGNAATSLMTTGNVGIGVVNPTSSLQIQSPTTTGYALVIATGAATSQQIVMISTGGVIYSAGGVTYAGDLAEMYPALDDAAAGDVVMLDGGARRASVRKAVAGKKLALGVISTQPGMTIGAKDLGQHGLRAVPVALSGRVPVKVSFENGPIEAGTPLAASSRAGYAARAVRSGPVIGFALEDASEGGTVLCFVKSQYWVDPAEHEAVLRRLDRLESRLNGAKVSP